MVDIYDEPDIEEDILTPDGGKVKAELYADGKILFKDPSTEEEVGNYQAESYSEAEEVFFGLDNQTITRYLDGENE